MGTGGFSELKFAEISTDQKVLLEARAAYLAVNKNGRDLDRCLYILG